MATAMKHLLTELLAAMNTHDVDRLAALYHPNYEGVDVAQARSRRGPADVSQAMRRYLAAFPDLSFTGETVTQGKRTVLIWTARGTHRGAVMNIPATGRVIEVRGVSIFTVQHGQFIHGLHIWDVAGLLRTIGLLPNL